MASTWNGAVALVTGAGSGIGRALSEAMAKRGATVYVTDIDAKAASAVASALGGAAHAEGLDVTNAVAFQKLVDTIATKHGKLDYLVNNAGIGVGGELQDLTLDHWQRIMAVNVWGVIHGVQAAYPRMVKQRSGHILNVASLAGLGPSPLLTPYAATKHAVVGLSTSLRIEAAAYGVKVSVLCPSAIETPMLDKDNPGDLPKVWRPDIRRFLTRLAGPPYPVQKLAEETLDGVEHNEALIVIPARARLAWRLARFAPGLLEKGFAPAVAAERAERK